VTLTTPWAGDDRGKDEPMATPDYVPQPGPADVATRGVRDPREAFDELAIEDIRMAALGDLMTLRRRGSRVSRIPLSRLEELAT
jgi:hypothetical protein